MCATSETATVSVYCGQCGRQFDSPVQIDKGGKAVIQTARRYCYDCRPASGDTTTKTCVVCGSRINHVFGKRGRTDKFCSNECRMTHRRLAYQARQSPVVKASLACVVCGAVMFTHQSNKKFCSKECRSKYRVTLVCVTCKKPFASTREGVKYCGDCAREAVVAARRSRNTGHTGLSAMSDIGTAAESAFDVPCALRTWRTFIPINGACPDFDRVLVRGNKCDRVQVKALRTDVRDGVVHRTARIFRRAEPYREDAFDLLAVVDCFSMEAWLIDWQEFRHTGKQSFNPSKWEACRIGLCVDVPG